MEVATQTEEAPKGYYTEAVKRAIYNYRAKNAEKVKEGFKKYAKNRYDNDEKHREQKKKKALENYYKRKEKLKNFIISPDPEEQPDEPKEIIEPKEEPKKEENKTKEGELLNFYLNNGFHQTMKNLKPMIKDI